MAAGLRRKWLCLLAAALSITPACALAPVPAVRVLSPLPGRVGVGQLKLEVEVEAWSSDGIVCLFVDDVQAGCVRSIENITLSGLEMGHRELQVHLVNEAHNSVAVAAVAVEVPVACTPVHCAYISPAICVASPHHSQLHINDTVALTSWVVRQDWKKIEEHWMKEHPSQKSDGGVCVSLNKAAPQCVDSPIGFMMSGLQAGSHRVTINTTIAAVPMQHTSTFSIPTFCVASDCIYPDSSEMQSPSQHHDAHTHVSHLTAGVRAELLRDTSGAICGCVQALWLHREQHTFLLLLALLLHRQGALQLAPQLLTPDPLELRIRKWQALIHSLRVRSGVFRKVPPVVPGPLLGAQEKAELVGLAKVWWQQGRYFAPKG